jgi:DNA-binding transcriptional ArsR family regulator
MSTPRPLPLSAPQLRAVARLFGVLAEPSRLALLQGLQSGPLSVTDLVAITGMKQANVSKHLAVLHHHRLVERERQGSTVFYAIADPMIFPLCGLVCGKMERDAKAAVDLFREAAPPRRAGAGAKAARTKTG